MNVEKNGLYEGTVEALGSGGEGIVRCGGTTAFVPFCNVGEEVRFRVLKTQEDGRIAYGKAEEILKSSPVRTEAPCPLFKRCGGCDLQHMVYSAQLEFKRTLVENTLKKLGGIYAPVNATVPCEREYRYRNKLALPIGVDGEGNTVLGFYARRSHRIVPAEDCLIQSEWVKNIISAVKKYADVCGLKGYDEKTRSGELRQIVVREIKGKFIIALVATRKTDVKPLILELEKYFSSFTLLLNVNSSTSNVIFSEEWHICRGEGRFEAEEGGIFYGAGAETFVQVNDDMRAKLYARVLAEVGENATAIDLYSGGGLLTAMLAKKCGRAFGVEVVKEASLCAEELRRRNGLEGKMFNICGKVEEKLGEVLHRAVGKRVIVCDPPRKGMERSVCEKLASCGADKIILISCNPATLARDTGIILGSEKGFKREEPSSPYKILSVTPFDMFPQTRHVETLVCLEKI